jgi:hypothetical protein
VQPNVGRVIISPHPFTARSYDEWTTKSSLPSQKRIH